MLNNIKNEIKVVNKNFEKSFYSNEISKDNEIEKPILIRSLSKPKLKVMRFSKFCNTVEE